ncbi:hypothetical protein BOX15_Mlig030787g3 [Macrostomum lignano]|uniref:Uncharacterized protein n=1 Tax=Macrostomum lignano TaxID=282301 RepID=A0A267H6L4_9PLAT|nr:hypothetical protein BOX15_Mlig030787g3 [Macrostomum lignano]
MALVQQPMDFRFPWYQQAGSAQAPPESAGTASQPQAQAQHQQQSADVEREFQAAMQFYSRGGGSGGGVTSGFPLAPSDYVSPDERLRLCQEPLVPYKPLASGSQSKSQKQQQQQQPATAVKSRRPSKDGAVQTDLSLPLPAWSPWPTPLTALLGASVDSKDGEGAVEELQRERQPRQPALRRSSSFVELTTRPTAGDSAGRPPPSPSIRRPRTPPASILRKEQPRPPASRPTSATPAAGARPAQRGPVWGGDERSITGLQDLPTQQLYDLTQLRRSNLRLNDELGPDPTKVYMGNKLVDRPFPAEHPFASHQPRKAVFPRFAPPQPGSEPSHPDRLELVERAGSGQWRHEVFHLGGPPRHLVWPGDNFDQVPKLSSRHLQPVYYPVPPQLLGANASMRPDPAADPAAVDTLRNLERDQWRSQYSRSFTGRGQEFPVALTDWQEKQTEALMRGASGGGSAMMEMQQRGHHSFEPPRPQEGRIARRLAGDSPASLPGGLQGDSRAAAERVRPETDRERSERWLLEGREYRNLPDNWDALVQQQQWRAASQASSRPESPVTDESADGQRPAERDRADAKDGGYGGGQAWGSELESRYRDYSRRRVESDSRRSPQPGAIADTDARSDIAWLRRKYEPAASASWSFSDGAGLMNTLGLPGPAVGYLPGRPRLYELHDASSSAAPAAQKQQPLQQAKSSKGVNFDTDVMVAYGYGSEPVYLDQEQLRDSKQQQASSPWQPLPTTPYRTELHDLQRGYDRTQLRRQFHSEFPGRPDDLRDAVHEGRRHVIYGINSQVLHG